MLEEFLVTRERELEVKRLLENLEISYDALLAQKLNEVLYEKGNIQTAANRNEVFLKGTLKEEFKYSHVKCGEKYFTNILLVKYKSRTNEIYIKCPQSILLEEHFEAGNRVIITGRFDTRHKNAGERKEIIAEVAIDSIRINENSTTIDTSFVYLEGEIYESPKSFTTARGCLYEFAIKLKHRIFYCYDVDNEELMNLKVGNHVKINGFIQSRTFYWKKGEIYRTINEILVEDIINLDEIHDEVV